MTSSRATAVDKLVGRNLRVYRLKKGLSQTDLADQLGVSFQQIQKYENGSNRVSSGRLLQVASVMDVPVTAFFEGSEDARRLDHKSVYDQLAHPQSLRLIQAFSEITDQAVRRSLVQLVEQIAGTASNASAD